MGGIMWALRWLAAVSILANCVMMPIDAALDPDAVAERYSKPLIVQDEERWGRT